MGHCHSKAKFLTYGGLGQFWVANFENSSYIGEFWDFHPCFNT